MEYALAKIYLAICVQPSFLIGHSIGEYTALCIAGAFDFNIGLSLVVERGRLMSQADNGGMLLISKDKTQVQQILKEVNYKLDIAVINNNRNVVVSGSIHDIDKLSSCLNKKHIINKKLKVSGAFHSPLMENAANQFKLFCSQYQFNKCKFPVISNVTANPIDQIDPDYLANHIVNPVQFEDSLKNFTKTDRAIYLEIGPGNDMLKMAHPTINKVSIKIQSMHKSNSYEAFLDSVGKLYEAGIDINWSIIYPTSHLSDSPVYQFNGNSYPLNNKNYRITIDRKQTKKKVKTGVIEKNDSINYQLKQIISEVSGADIQVIKQESNFMYDLGFDSIMMVSLRNQINQVGLGKQDHRLADLIKLNTVGDLIGYLNHKNREDVDENY